MADLTEYAKDYLERLPLFLNAPNRRGHFGRVHLDRHGWVCSRKTDDRRYEKTLPDGRVLRTKVSCALQDEIPRPVWVQILQKQLLITEEDFRQDRGL